jgi:hypothetical protein
MADGAKCKCQRCSIGGLMGPVVLITIGLLFLLGRLSWGYPFSRLWPVLLIVIGAVKLAEALASTEGHISPGASGG